MLIALLAVLGVDLIVLVALTAFVFARKRWVKRQPGAFHGTIRVADGDEGQAARRPPRIRVTADGATVEVAAKAEDTERLLGPYRKPADATAAGSGRL